MQQVRLGRTDLSVSVAGLGAGGPSRLGLRTGADRESMVALVRRALDLGVTYLDTAPTYGTEEIVGEAIAGRRDEVVLSTKVRSRARDGGPRNDADGVRATFETSLKLLRTDVVDVLHLHAVLPEDYDYAVGELLPVLDELRREGTVRFLAISEEFPSDPAHGVLSRAVADDLFDVVMVGFNLLNPSARHGVLPAAAEGDLGVEVMYAVRRALSRPEHLREIVAGLVAEGRVDGGAVDAVDPLGFLVDIGGARSVVDSAYRFARHAAPNAVILTGTGSEEHLAENIDSINAGPLAREAGERLDVLFGHLAHLSED